MISIEGKIKDISTTLIFFGTFVVTVSSSAQCRFSNNGSEVNFLVQMLLKV
jgi:hypothetical protein